MLRPSVVIRRQALSKGVIGGSWLWRIVATVVFGRSILKRVFGRNPEYLGTIHLKQDRSMMVQTIKPISRRQRRRRRRAGLSLTPGERRREAQALAMALSKADD